jgi:hypothetical protein
MLKRSQYFKLIFMVKKSVFISYRQGQDNCHLIPDLARHLKSHDIEVIWDQDQKAFGWGGPDSGIPAWSRHWLKNATKVLVIPSTGYCEEFERTNLGSPDGRGVSFEAYSIIEMLYDDKQQNERIRVVRLDQAPIPNLLKTYFYFDFREPENHNRLIHWIRGDVVISSADKETGILQRNDQQIDHPIRWPSPVDFHHGLANRNVYEWPYIRDLLTGQSKERILLLDGVSGVGKFALLKKTRDYAKELGLSCVALNFGVHVWVLQDILKQMGLVLSNGKSAPPTTDVLSGLLRRLKTPLLILVDHYEKVALNHKIDKWLNLELLNQMPDMPAVAVIISGIKLPNGSEAYWPAHARQHTVKPIDNPNQWIEWASREHPKIPQTEITTFVKESKGLPIEIINCCHSYEPRQTAISEN